MTGGGRGHPSSWGGRRRVGTPTGSARAGACAEGRDVQSGEVPGCWPPAAASRDVPAAPATYRLASVRCGTTTCAPPEPVATPPGPWALESDEPAGCDGGNGFEWRAGCGRPCCRTPGTGRCEPGGVMTPRWCLTSDGAARTALAGFARTSAEAGVSCDARGAAWRGRSVAGATTGTVLSSTPDTAACTCLVTLSRHEHGSEGAAGMSLVDNCGAMAPSTCGIDGTCGNTSAFAEPAPNSQQHAVTANAPPRTTSARSSRRRTTPPASHPRRSTTDTRSPPQRRLGSGREDWQEQPADARDRPPFRQIE